MNQNQTQEKKIQTQETNQEQNKKNQNQNKRGLMTSGPIARQIIAFAIPLLIGNLFQQLYNAVDAAVVGNYLGTYALAAVSSSGNLINLIVQLFMGIAIGGTVVISQHYGSGNKERLERAVHTLAAFSLAAGALMTSMGVWMAPQILRWMSTPEEVMDLASLYLRIFFGGSLVTVIYNIGAGELRAIGDSRRPLYFLIVSSLTNIVLDIFFVVVLNWGVAGVGIATITAQAVSAVLVVRVLTKTADEYRLTLRNIRFDAREFKLIVRLGLPSGIQNSVVSFSNVIVQSNINVFGAAAVAGIGAYAKLDGFALLPMLSCSMAMTTYIGQNIGAGELERVKKGAIYGLMLTCGIALCMVVCMRLGARAGLGIFTDDPEAIEYGLLMMRRVTIGYVIVAFSHGAAGILRGAGLTKVPMIVMILCWCGFRMVWVTQMAARTHDLGMVLYGYPTSWLLSTLIMIVYLWKSGWIHYYEKNIRS